MDSQHRVFGSSLGTIALLLTAYGCVSDVKLGEECERSSHCEAPYSCVLGRCRAECVHRRDCTLGGICVEHDGIGVCTRPEDLCAEDRDCPAPLVCGPTGVCSAACVSSEECLGGSVCQTLASGDVCVSDGNDENDGGPADEDSGTAADSGLDGGVDAGRDAASDAARDAGSDAGAHPCFGGVNPGFESGLSGWCVEASAGVDASSRARVSSDGAQRVLELDLDGAPSGSWLRAYQELPLREDAWHELEWPTRQLTSGVAMFTLEALDESGRVLSRYAMVESSSDMPAPCSAGSADGDRCDPVFGGDSVRMNVTVALGRLRTDVTRVRSIRRGIEIVAGPLAQARVVVNGTAIADPDCQQTWWRTQAHELFDWFDRPVSAPGAGRVWAGEESAPIRLFPGPVCGSAVLFEGQRWLEIAAGLPRGTAPFTTEVFWHAESDAAFEADATYALLWQEDGDLGLFIDDRRLRATAGACGGDLARPALEVVDTARPIGAEDDRIQDVTIVLDRAASRLCLAREGVLVGCDTTPACPLPMAGTGALRVGAGDPELHRGFRGSLDELRVTAGDFGPRAASQRSGRCFLDLACATGRRVRDFGSLECVEASSCDTLAPCPSAAAPVPQSCPSVHELDCYYDAACFAGTATCQHGCVRSDSCVESVAASRPSCE